MLQLKQNFPKWTLPTVIVVFILLGVYIYALTTPVSSAAGDAVIVTVKPGMSTYDIGELLHNQGLIKNALLFRVVARLEGMQNSLQAGEYAFSKNMTVQRIVAMLAKGETAYKQFTIPEGYTINQVATLLESKNLASAAKIKAYAATYAPYDYMATPNAVNYKAEGYMFPDTYRISAGTSEEQLVKIMVNQFDRQFTPAMRQRAEELGLPVRDVITLASLVEKEAKVEKERPIIAGVFLNRLKQSMPLQSCATIQYILGYPKPELTLQDTELPSPYNTYLNPGLPPGPIANPGVAAINAVLYPADTEYLFFVANKDGSHQFSRTYDEHLAAIEMVSR